MFPPDDVAADVVRRAVAGDDRAFATMVEHYDPMLRELVFHLLGDRNGMDEVLQNAYLKAYRALPRLTAKTEPGPWLYRIAYLETLTELRRRHRRPDRPWAASGSQANGPLAEDPSAPPAPAAQESAFSRELASLPVDHRAAVLLADRAGLPIVTICTVLGLPEAGATKALTRAESACIPRSTRTRRSRSLMSSDRIRRRHRRGRPTRPGRARRRGPTGSR